MTSRMHHPANRAFTLIELLIVVAIIAILAAIAVPNFLEAQVRSKVARTMSDMRTVATALEAYKTDISRYPPDLSYNVVAVGASPAMRARVSAFLGRLMPLTSPIAYISALPEDFFARQLAVSGLPGASSNPWREGSATNGRLHSPIVYDYAAMDRNIAHLTHPLDSPSIWMYVTSNTGSVEWGLNSVGPDISTYQFIGQADFRVYDPSNGTISQGQIVRTNLGADDKRSN